VIRRLRRWLGLLPPEPRDIPPGKVIYPEKSTGPQSPRDDPPAMLRKPPSARWAWLSYTSEIYGSEGQFACPLVIMVIADLMGDASEPGWEFPGAALFTLTDNDPAPLLQTLHPWLTLEVAAVEDTDQSTPVTLRFEEMADFTPAGLARQVDSPVLVSAVLHHPDFQALRDRWLGLARLARAAGTDGLVATRVLPASLASLHRYCLPDGADVEQFPLTTLLRNTGRCYQAPPISLVVADYPFGDSCASRISRRLFTTPHIPEMVSLVHRGLAAVYGPATAAGA